MSSERQLKWDLRYLRIAGDRKYGVASWSKDPSTQVGALLVDPHNCVRALGYNGFPAGLDDTEERLNDRELKYPLTIHAEANVLERAPETYLTGYTMYSSLPTCTACAIRIIQRKVARVVTIVGNDNTRKKWYDEWVQAQALYAEAGIDVTTYSALDVFPSDGEPHFRTS